MMSKKVDLKKTGEHESKDRFAILEENEFVNGGYYAPWDI